MNEQSNNIDAQGRHSSGEIDSSLPSYLLESALDREWEHRHRQGQFEMAPGTRAEEEKGL